MACNISYYRIRVFLQYVFALLALGFDYYQPLKQELPNDVTDEGMVIEVKPLQPKKQDSSNEVTDEGMVIEVKPLQLEYLLLVDYQCYTL